MKTSIDELLETIDFVRGLRQTAVAQEETIISIVAQLERVEERLEALERRQVA